jgi:hypothetical protein
MVLVFHPAFLDTIFGVCYRPRRSENSPPGVLHPDLFTMTAATRLETLLMNVRRFAVLLIAITMGFIPRAASAAATLPADVRTTTNSAAVRSAIQTFITDHLEQLSSSTPATQSVGRDAITNEVQPPPPGQPALSPAFLDAYSDVLNTALLPLANNPDPRVRLNAAITAAKVAEAAGNTRLMPLVVDLLDDKSEAVLIWAIKASKSILPQLLSNAITRQNNPLLPAFIKAVQQHSASGPITQASYEALRLDANSNIPPAAWNNVVPIVVSTVQQLVQNRISLYRTGIPKLSSADAIATAFLVDTRVWKAQPKAEQQQTVQTILDLLSVASQRWDAAGISDRQDLTELINKSAQGIWVVGQSVGDPKLQQASAFKVIPLSPTKEILAHVDAVRTAALAVPDYADLKPSPVLDPIAAPTTTTNPSE